MILPEGGTHRVRHVYGGEVARFLCRILGRQETFGRAYNVAQDETPTLAELVAALRDLLGSRAELVPISASRLRDSGLDPAAVSPFSTRWMSFLDPSRATRELGFRHAPLSDTLGRIVASFLAHVPVDRPVGYGRRQDEVRIAAAQ